MLLLRTIHAFWVMFIYTDALQDCPTNDLLVYTDDVCITMYLIPPFTNMYGSNVTYRCSSRLQQLPASTLDFCPVEICMTTTSLWSDGYLSCGQNECYNPGSSIAYQGRRTCGLSGTQCQSWSAQTPHAHPYTSQNFSEGSITLAKNYCRDPSGVYGQPWCFTTNPNIVWEYCEIPKCADLPITYGNCAPTTTVSPSTTSTASTTTTHTTTTTPSTTKSSTSAPTTATLGIGAGQFTSFYYTKIFVDLPNYIQIQYLPTTRSRLSCAGKCNERIDCNVYAINQTTTDCILFTFNTTGSNIPCTGSYFTCYLRDKH